MSPSKISGAIGGVLAELGLARPFDEDRKQEEDAALIERIDHFVLTVRSVDATCAFYERTLGFRRIDAANKPTSLLFGRQKINIHQSDRTFEPKAAHPTTGASDFCLITKRPLSGVVAHLQSCNVNIELGPIGRDGAMGKMASIYFRDPDGNLIEVSRYEDLTSSQP